MNIAVPALLLVALILPGIVFRRKFREGTWPSPPRKQSVVKQILDGLLAAAILHLLWLAVASGFGYSPDLELISRLLLIEDTPDNSGALSADVAENLVPAIVYFSTLYGFGFAAGSGLHRLVRHFRLDITFKLFRFDNPWYYILTGDHHAVPDDSQSLFSAIRNCRETWSRLRRVYRDSRDGEEVVFARIQAIHEIAGEAYLYQGLLEEWHFDTDGRLDRIILTDAARRPLSEDRPQDKKETELPEHTEDYLDDPRYVNIETDYCIFRVDELRNMSVQWIRFRAGGTGE